MSQEQKVEAPELQSEIDSNSDSECLMHPEEDAIVQPSDSLSSILAKPQKTRSGITACLGPMETFFTLFKGLVAIGILYLPKGFSHAGWLFSIAAFGLCALFTFEGLNRLVSSHERVGGSYQRLAKKAAGPWLKWCLEFALFTSQVCVIVAF